MARRVTSFGTWSLYEAINTKRLILCLQAALHPTPAVCGRPRTAAKDILASQEPFDRGFYSGPFGWLSGSAAEFVVAIRSALIHPRDAPVSDKPPNPLLHPRDAPVSDRPQPAFRHSRDVPVSEGPQPTNAKTWTGSGNGSEHLPPPTETPVGDWAAQQADLQSVSRGDVGMISLFAGVGIVKGSTAEAEWQV